MKDTIIALKAPRQTAAECRARAAADRLRADGMNRRRDRLNLEASAISWDKRGELLGRLEISFEKRERLDAEWALFAAARQADSVASAEPSREHTMRMAIILATTAFPLSACDLVQQAAENQIRAEVSERVGATENSLRNSTDLDERFGNMTNKVAEGEAAIRQRASREIHNRSNDVANSTIGPQE